MIWSCSFSYKERERIGEKNTRHRAVSISLRLWLMWWIHRAPSRDRTVMKTCYQDHKLWFDCGEIAHHLVWIDDWSETQILNGVVWYRSIVRYKSSFPSWGLLARQAPLEAKMEGSCSRPVGLHGSMTGLRLFLKRNEKNSALPLTDA